MMRGRLIVGFILVLSLASVMCARLIYESRSAAPRLSFSVSYFTRPPAWHDFALATDDSRTRFVYSFNNSAQYGAYLCVTNECGVDFQWMFTTEILCDGKWIPALVQPTWRVFGGILPASSALTPGIPLPNEPVEWRVNCSLQRIPTRIEAWVTNVMRKVGLRYPIGIRKHLLISPGFRSEGIAQPIASGTDAPPVSLRESQE
jgi:hypothetical protein